jgi:CBS domain-containing protein
MLNRKIAEVMTFPTCSVEPNTTIHRAAELMAEHGVGTLPVCDGSTVVGIITDRDITVRATALGATPDGWKCSDAMTVDVQTCRTDEACDEVLERMARMGIRRMPVVGDDGHLVGIVALGDLVHQDAARTGRALDRISEPKAAHRT